MFAISITLARFDALTGLDALDERRRLQLPDGSQLSWFGYNQYAECAVDEGFARVHFSRTVTKPIRSVSLSILCPGDTITTGEKLSINPALAPERIRELWLASK